MYGNSNRVKKIKIFSDTPRLSEANEYLAEYPKLWTDLKRGRLFNIYERLKLKICDLRSSILSWNRLFQVGKIFQVGKLKVISVFPTSNGSF